MVIWGIQISTQEVLNGIVLIERQCQPATPGIIRFCELAEVLIGVKLTINYKHIVHHQAIVKVCLVGGTTDISISTQDSNV